MPKLTTDSSWRKRDNVSLYLLTAATVSHATVYPPLQETERLFSESLRFLWFSVMQQQLTDRKRVIMFKYMKNFPFFFGNKTLLKEIQVNHKEVSIINTFFKKGFGNGKATHAGASISL